MKVSDAWAVVVAVADVYIIFFFMEQVHIAFIYNTSTSSNVFSPLMTMSVHFYSYLKSEQAKKKLLLLR